MWPFTRNKQKNKKISNEPILVKNTLTGKLEQFTPLTPGVVKMYNCGPTVYSEQHLGNMRAAVFADSLRRMFEFNGYTVKQVINITDVGHLTSDADSGEDKLEKKAKESNESAQDIAKHITDIYMKDLKSLGVDTSKIQFPRATEYIDAQIELTKTLIEKGYAYKIDHGVAFDTGKFKDYGKLGNIDLESQQAGARVEQDAQKHNPHDFWLWKLSEKPGIRQQEWDSPWGVGFPGWHIECTAMSRALLGKQLDVHTGGIEHIPIHHNNEIAQSEALSGKQFVKYWMHNSHLLLDGKKMSKSDGHVVYLHNVLDKGYSPLAVRYLFLTANYDSEQNFTWSALGSAQTALLKIKKHYIDNLIHAEPGQPDTQYMQKFNSAINDNLNTAKAISILWDLIKDKEISPESKKVTLQKFDTVLGLQIPSSTHNKKLDVKIDKIPEKVGTLIEMRKKARHAKDWAQSDKLRDEINKLGYKIIDKGDQQILEKI